MLNKSYFLIEIMLLNIWFAKSIVFTEIIVDRNRKIYGAIYINDCQSFVDRVNFVEHISGQYGSAH